VIGAVVFDLDGVLLDSEHLWDAVRREVAAEHGALWTDRATADMQGMSSLEWSRYLREVVGVALDEREIDELVVSRLLDRYEDHLPVLAGAIDAVRRLGRQWPLALASSSNRVVIDRVLALADLQDLFEVTVSSEEVARGKPAPDVYLEVARRLGQSPERCVAIEDSASGIRSALAARLKVVAVPDRHFPPPPELLAKAKLVCEDLSGVTIAGPPG
jgi:HAD superfamily hydrolase (TIGR01509 family)